MPKAKFNDIYKDLKKKIEAHAYPYQSLLPSEHELTEVYDCSRNTVRRALRGLIERGYAQAIQGKGVRVRYLDGKPLILDKNLFRADLVPGLTPEIASHSIYAYIEDTLGMTIVTSKRRMTVERATEEDEVLLDLGDYNCLAVITSQTFNDNGIQLEYTVSRHHPERFCFEDTATRQRTTAR